MTIALIAAMARNRVIGRDNKLPWNIPEDLKYFRAKTAGHPVIMGRKTFESILNLVGRPLPGRLNIVVTRQTAFTAPSGVRVVGSLEAAVEAARGVPGSDEVFVLGGAEIYAQSLAIADRLYITWIDRDYEGDARFPVWDSGEFREVSRDERPGDPSFSFVVFERTL
jgi:dihydrofolate reductase